MVRSKEGHAPEQSHRDGHRRSSLCAHAKRVACLGPHGRGVLSSVCSTPVDDGCAAHAHTLQCSAHMPPASQKLQALELLRV